MFTRGSNRWFKITLAQNSDQCGYLASQRELFLLWLRCLDFLCLVLQISERGARTEFEGQRLLRNASLSRHGNFLPARRAPQRHADPRCRAAGWKMRCRLLCDGACCRLPCLRLEG